MAIIFGGYPNQVRDSRSARHAAEHRRLYPTGNVLVRLQCTTRSLNVDWTRGHFALLLSRTIRVDGCYPVAAAVAAAIAQLLLGNHLSVRPQACDGDQHEEAPS